MHAVPGGPFDKEKKLPPEIQANKEKYYHLDDPLPVQFFSYLSLVTIPRSTTTPPTLNTNYHFTHGLFRTTLAQPQEGTFAYYRGQLDSKFGGLLFIMIGIGLTGWETQARLTREQVLSVREKEYIEASRALGATNGRLIFRHILPNIWGPLIVLETLSIPGYIYTEAFLSFIGLGVNPPTPSWGSMISAGSRALRAYPNQALFPALALTMFAFNFLGDGLRDALEPRSRGTQE